MCVVLRLDCLNPVCHLLIELLERAELQVVFLLHVGVDNCAILSLASAFFLGYLGVKNSLLLRKVSDQSFPIGVAQQAQEIVDLVENE